MTTRIKNIVLGMAVTLVLLVSSSPTWAQYHHASTAFEGALRGRADLIQAQSQAWVNYTLALSQFEAARGQRLANCEAHRRYLAAKKELRAAKEQGQLAAQAIRRTINLQKAAKRHAESPIDWPVALKAKRYDSRRNEIEELDLFRSKLGSDASDAISIAIRHSICVLAKQIVQDEKAHSLDDDQSQVVRTFVRNLYSEQNPARAHTQLVLYHSLMFGLRLVLESTL